jgi:hypothetical protein
VLVALGALAAASVAGAGGGLIYYFVGRPTRRVPVVGPYLAGVVVVAGYMGCIVTIMAIGGAKDVMIGSSADAIIFGAITVFFGLIVGHMWFRPKKLEA